MLKITSLLVLWYSYSSACVTSYLDMLVLFALLCVIEIR